MIGQLHPNNARRIIASILERVDLPDPHEFCTAYVDHAESVRSQLGTPMSITVAVQRWLSLGSL